MQRLIGTAFQPADVFIDVGIGCRTNNGAVNDQMLEIAHAGLFLQQAHGGRFHIKNANGVAAGNEVDGLRVLQRIPLRIIKLGAIILFDGGQSIANHGKRAITQDIHFDQTHVLSLIFFPLYHLNTSFGHLAARHANRAIT